MHKYITLILHMHNYVTKVLLRNKYCHKHIAHAHRSFPTHNHNKTCRLAPLRAASWSGVAPCASCLFTSASAPLASKKCIMLRCPDRAAACSAVHPLCVSACTFAPNVSTSIFATLCHRHRQHISKKSLQQNAYEASPDACAEQRCVPTNVLLVDVDVGGRL